jgi:dihydrofolate reductase
MSELLVDFITSVDGYAAAEGWPGYWGLEGPEYLAWLDQSPERNYTILMGATTYRLMSGVAASSDDDSFEQLTTMSKVVFSSTLGAPLAWANTRLVDGDPVEAVRSLKAETTIPGLRTIGSLTLCRSLLEAGLVDRFRVVVFPVITGKTGRERIYDGYPDVGLEMVDSRTFDGRLQLLEYVPTVLSVRPAAINRRPERARFAAWADVSANALALSRGATAIGCRGRWSGLPSQRPGKPIAVDPPSPAPRTILVSACARDGPPGSAPRSPRRRCAARSAWPPSRCRSRT